MNYLKRKVKGLAPSNRTQNNDSSGKEIKSEDTKESSSNLVFSETGDEKSPFEENNESLEQENWESMRSKFEDCISLFCYFLVENNITAVLSFIFHPSVEGNFFHKIKKTSELVGSPQLSISSSGNLYKSLEERTFKTFPLSLRIGILKGVLMIINQKCNAIRLRIIFKEKFRIDYLDYILSLLIKPECNLEEEIIQLYCKIIGRLGSGGISVKTLGNIFKYMLLKPLYQTYVLNAMCEMMSCHRYQREISPEYYFDFYGNKSGIEYIPNNNNNSNNNDDSNNNIKSLFSNGYLLYLWIRPNPMSLSSSNLLLLTTSTQMIELSFQDSLLCYSVQNSNETKNEITIPYSFQPYNWYYIIISHKKSVFKDQFNIIINGNQILKQNISYINKIKDLNNFKWVIGKGYNGLMGSCMMFSSDAKIESNIPISYDINALYSNPYIYNDVDLILHQKELIFYYNPTLHFKNILIDTLSHNYSKLLQNTAIWKEISIIQALNIIGGINVLLPLFTYVKRDDSKVSLCDIFSLLSSLIDNNFILSNDMMRSYAPESIGVLLRQLSHKYLDEDGTIESIITLIKTVKNQVKLATTLIYQLLNINIWKRTKFETHRRLYDNIKNIISEEDGKKKSYLQLNNWVQYLLDNIRYLYYSEIPPISIYGNWNNIPNNSSKTDNNNNNNIKDTKKAMFLLQSQIQSTSLTKEEKDELREKCMFLIKLIFENQVYLSDIKQMLSLCIETKDSGIIISILLLFNKLLKSIKFYNILQNYKDIDLIELFLHYICNNENESVRLLGIIIVIQLIRFDSTETKRNRSKTMLKSSIRENTNSLNTSTKDNNSNNNSNENNSENITNSSNDNIIVKIDWIGAFEDSGGFVTLNKMITEHETTSLTINVIMNLMFLSNTEQVAIEYSNFIQPFSIKDNCSNNIIKNPLFLTSLFTILSKQPKDYTVEMLNNMKLLFENRENGNIISYEPMCIYSILKFYHDNINNDNEDSALPPPPPSLSPLSVPSMEGLKSPKPESSSTECNEVCGITKSLILSLINISTETNPLNSLIFNDLYSAESILSPDDLSLFYELLNTYTDSLTKKVKEIIEEGGDTSKSVERVVNLLLFIEPLYLNYYPTVNGKPLYSPPPELDKDNHCIYCHECPVNDVGDSKKTNTLHIYEAQLPSTLCFKCNHFHFPSQAPEQTYPLHDILFPLFQSYISLLDDSGNKQNEIYWKTNVSNHPAIYTVIKLLIRLITSGPIGSLYQYNLFYQLRRFVVELLSNKNKQNCEYIGLIIVHLHSYLYYIYDLLVKDHINNQFPPMNIIQYTGVNMYKDSGGYNKEGIPKIINEIATSISNIVSIDPSPLHSMFVNYNDMKSFINMQAGELLELNGKLNIESMLNSKWFNYEWIYQPIMCENINNVLNKISNEEENIYNEFNKKFNDFKTIISYNTDKLKVDLTNTVEEKYKQIISNEIERLIRQKKREKQENDINKERWEKIYKNLCLKGQAWEDTSLELHYKLSMKVSSSFTRELLEINYNYSNYEECMRQNDTKTPRNENKPEMKLIPLSKSLTSSSHFHLINEAELEDAIDTSISGYDDLLNYIPFKIAFYKDKPVYHTNATLVHPLKEVEGMFIMGKYIICFVETESQVISTWNLYDTTMLFSRLHLLQPNSIELYFCNGESCFFVFPTTVIRNKIFNILLSYNLPLLIYKPSLNAYDALIQNNFLKKWQNREISNFEYLMILNIYSGRSYNDMSQYPVFPWIIKDYDNEKIDVENEGIYRDLSKPIGAIDEEKAEMLKQRYEEMRDSDIPPFHYGTHYSSVGSTLFYLIRIEPFTNLHITFQGGRFDVPDRLFISLKAAYESSTQSNTDCKELIPEFYYNPYFLLNSEKYKFGMLSNGEEVNNVTLPKWSENAYDFINKHKEALESEYISEHLNDWIDLIFGYKQRGEEAEKCVNIYYYLTYDGAVDMNEIEDENLRKTYEEQIYHFGQSPLQLFKEVHPKRNSTDELPLSRFYNCKGGLNISIIQDIINDAVIFVSYEGDYIICVTDKLEYHRIGYDSLRDLNAIGYNPSNDRKGLIGKEINQQLILKELGSEENNDLRSQCLLSMSHYSKESNYLLSCNYLDGSIRYVNVFNDDYGMSIGHNNIVTCIDSSEDGSYIICGSEDCTVSVWRLYSTINANYSYDINVLEDHETRGDNFYVKVNTLHGHTSGITCVRCILCLDTSLSTSENGHYILHSLTEGSYRISGDHPNHYKIDYARMGQNGMFLLHSNTDNVSYIYTVNGQLLYNIKHEHILTSAIFSWDCHCIVIGYENGDLVFYKCLTGCEISHILEEENDAVLSMCVLKSDQGLIVGHKSGTIFVYTA